MKDEGWTDSDGILDKDGRKLSFELKTNPGNKNKEDTVIYVQNMLKKVGRESRFHQLSAGLLGGPDSRKYLPRSNSMLCTAYTSLSVLNLSSRREASEEKIVKRIPGRE